jgi:hypothetical protein
LIDVVEGMVENLKLVGTPDEVIGKRADAASFLRR